MQAGCQSTQHLEWLIRIENKGLAAGREAGEEPRFLKIEYRRLEGYGSLEILILRRQEAYPRIDFRHGSPLGSAEDNQADFRRNTEAYWGADGTKAAVHVNVGHRNRSGGEE